MKITHIPTGGRGYYVLLDEDGYPLAQGTWNVCRATQLSIEHSDFPRQAMERLRFYGCV